MSISFIAYNKKEYYCQNVEGAKHSFLRELREVAPEMELFLENHRQYIKTFVINQSTYKFVHFAILQKNCI